MTDLIDRIEDHPYLSLDGAYMLISFNVYKDEIFDAFGSWEYDDISFGEVEIRLAVWSAFGQTIYSPFVQQAGASWENRNHEPLLAIAMDAAHAKREKHDEEMAEGRR